MYDNLCNLIVFVFFEKNEINFNYILRKFIQQKTSKIVVFNFLLKEKNLLTKI